MVVSTVGTEVGTAVGTAAGTAGAVLRGDSSGRAAGSAATGSANTLMAPLSSINRTRSAGTSTSAFEHVRLDHRGVQHFEHQLVRGLVLQRSCRIQIENGLDNRAAPDQALEYLPRRLAPPLDVVNQIVFDQVNVLPAFAGLV